MLLLLSPPLSRAKDIKCHSKGVPNRTSGKGSSCAGEGGGGPNLVVHLDFLGGGWMKKISLHYFPCAGGGGGLYFMFDSPDI